MKVCVALGAAAVAVAMQAVPAGAQSAQGQAPQTTSGRFMNELLRLRRDVLCCGFAARCEAGLARR